MAIYLGIDPGVQGAVAFQTPYTTGVFDIPTTSEEISGKKTPAGNPRKRNVYNLMAIRNNLTAVFGRDGDPEPFSVFAFCENTNAHPGLAVSAVWAQAQGIMLWPAMLVGMGVPGCTMVHPQRWKKDLDLLKTDKEASLALARELFPDLADDRLKRKMDHNRAEALLIMEYGKRVTGQA